jgi:hypothetical protein
MFYNETAIWTNMTYLTYLTFKAAKLLESRIQQRIIGAQVTAGRLGKEPIAPGIYRTSCHFPHSHTCEENC